MKRIALILTVMMAGSAFAIEFMMSTRDLAQKAEYVAHVRLEGSYTSGGAAHVSADHTIKVIECLKGNLPERIIVRIVRYPGAALMTPGMEYVLFLGRKNAGGFYPLISLEQGSYRIAPDANFGKRVANRITGFGAARKGGSVDELRALIKSMR
jgi:hypothetical protein